MPVVFGLLNIDDTAQYIKITRTFQNKDANALNLLNNPDSIYFDTLNVFMLEKINNQLVKNISLKKVDGNLEGHKKSTGLFPVSPNYLYKTNEKLNHDAVYELNIQNIKNGNSWKAKTGVIDSFTLLYPFPGSTIDFLPNKNISFVVNPAINASYYSVGVTIFYTEIKQSGIAILKSLTWGAIKVSQNYQVIGGNYYFTPSSNNFFEFLHDNIPVDSDVSRGMTSVVVSIDGMNEIVYTYLQEQNANSGITGLVINPVVSNIENGLGIFSTRNSNQYLFHLGTATISAIMTNPLTQNLNFHF